MGGVVVAHTGLLEVTTPDCFWCGRSIEPGRSYWFSIENGAAPEAPIHPECLGGRNPLELSLAYHRWMGDFAGAPRESFLPHLKANVLPQLNRPTRAA